MLTWLKQNLGFFRKSFDWLLGRLGYRRVGDLGVVEFDERRHEFLLKWLRDRNAYPNLPAPPSIQDLLRACDETADFKELFRQQTDNALLLTALYLGMSVSFCMTLETAQRQTGGFRDLLEAAQEEFAANYRTSEGIPYGRYGRDTDMTVIHTYYNWLNSRSTADREAFWAAINRRRHEQAT